MGKIVFKDVLMFSSPCNLDQYLRQWNSISAKSIFPYSFFDSIEAVKDQISFPTKDAFKNELRKTQIDDATYDAAKTEYERRQALSKNDPDKIHTFEDWLIYYNLLDTAPLHQAVDKCFESFHSYFKSDPMLHFSLPSLAFKAMFANYDENDHLIYSFNDSRLRKLFRANILGGLTSCYHRHINLTDTPSPYNSKFSPSNDRFSSIAFFDVNAMYLGTQMQPMPLTPGIEWTLQKKKFTKRSLQPGISFKSLQWLYYLQATEFKGIQIQHAYHRGEKTFNGHKVDGYALVNDQHVFMEFNGCYFHGHCKYHDQMKQDKWNLKANELRKLGKLIAINECDWDRFKCPQIPTQMPRILFKDDQNSILKGIETGELYGFLTCDVETPVAIQEEFEAAGFLFPFLIKKMEITEDLLSPYMQKRFIMREQKPSTTTIQCFNAKDIFLHTSLVQFYLSRGLKISNITHFVQFIGGTALKPFADQITQMRKEATYANDETKSLTSKLYGNSGYGFVLFSNQFLKLIQENNRGCRTLPKSRSSTWL